jgi:hypothetical protein
LGRFLSVDPITGGYPWYTPYQFAGNKPIQYIDLDGAEETLYGLAKEGVFGKTGSKIVKGSVEGVALSLKKAWSLFTNDLYKASTWKQVASALGTASDITIGNMDGRNDQLANNVIQPKVDNFNKLVIHGDAYTRSKYFSETITDFAIAALSSKGLGVAANTVKAVGGELFQGLRINIYGEGELGGFKDFATEQRFAEGGNGIVRPLTSTLKSRSASEIVINNSPLSETTLNEIGRLSKPGAMLTYTAAEAPGAANPFFSKLADYMKSRGVSVGEKSQTFLQGTADEYSVKTVTYKVNP